MTNLSKRGLLAFMLLQILAVFALVFALFAVYDEGQAVIKSNAKNFSFMQMQADDLDFSFSTLSKNRLLKTCFDAMNSLLALASDDKSNQARANTCALKANEIIAEEPNMSLAWVVIADSLLARGLYNEIEQKLLLSKKSAPNEGWLARARLVVFLKASEHLNLAKSEVFISDAGVVLGDRDGAQWFAKHWTRNEIARPAIENAVALAERSEQNTFMRMLR